MVEPYFAKRKPRRCPACSSDEVVRIAYGYPGPDLIADYEAGRVVLGGCCVSDADPSWRCMACGVEIYPERLRERFEASPEVFARGAAWPGPCE
jgi:hypothetical protein